MPEHRVKLFKPILSILFIDDSVLNRQGEPVENVELFLSIEDSLAQSPRLVVLLIIRGLTAL